MRGLGDVSRVVPVVEGDLRQVVVLQGHQEVHQAARGDLESVDEVAVLEFFFLHFCVNVKKKEKSVTSRILNVMHVSARSSRTSSDVLNTLKAQLLMPSRYCKKKEILLSIIREEKKARG